MFNRKTRVGLQRLQLWYQKEKEERGSQEVRKQRTRSRTDKRMGVYKDDCPYSQQRHKIPTCGRRSRRKGNDGYHEREGGGGGREITSASWRAVTKGTQRQNETRIVMYKRPLKATKNHKGISKGIKKTLNHHKRR